MEERIKQWTNKQKGPTEVQKISKDIDDLKRQLMNLSNKPKSLEAVGSAQHWFDGIGLPLEGIGSDGDYYFQIDNCDIHKKVFGVWERIGNNRGDTGYQGPKGEPGLHGSNGLDGTNGLNGTNGVNGASWYDGTGEPSNGIGSSNDYYLDLSNGDIYKNYGYWERVGNIIGPQGLVGPEADISHLEVAIEETITDAESRISIVDESIEQINNKDTEFTSNENIRISNEIAREEYVNTLKTNLSVLPIDIEEILSSI